MTTIGQVDGNALGGAMMELFGREMTDARSSCADCGAVTPLGGLVVFRAGPGSVVRCPGCGTVELVVVVRPAGLRFYFAALGWVEAVRSPLDTAR